MTKKILSFLAFVLLLNSAVALTCNGLSGGDYYVCDSIQKTSLSQQDKDLLISDIFNKNKISPNFDFVYSWNNNISITAPTDNKYYSSGTINNAWIKIIFFSPSILENNTIYLSEQGKVKTEYNYKYTLPSGTEYRDCKTTYSLKKETSALNVYLNDNYIGNSKLSQFSIQNSNIDLTLKSELSVKIDYKVTHYRKKHYNGYSKCVSYSTETRSDSLKISDLYKAKLYKLNPVSDFKIDNNYNNITRGVLTANNFTNLILSFNNSKYQNSKYIYSLNYSLPYYILTIKAEKIDSVKSSNIFVEKKGDSYLFTVKNSSNCKIQLFTHFNSISKDCNYKINETNISINTDKTIYYENETIKVFLEPNNLVINVSYGNVTKQVKNYTEFKAVLNQNKIYSKLNDRETASFVNVLEKENISMFFDLSSLSLVGFIFYRFVKAYYLGLSI